MSQNKPDNDDKEVYRGFRMIPTTTFPSPAAAIAFDEEFREKDLQQMSSVLQNPFHRQKTWEGRFRMRCVYRIAFTGSSNLGAREINVGGERNYPLSHDESLQSPDTSERVIGAMLLLFSTPPLVLF